MGVRNLSLAGLSLLVIALVITGEWINQRRIDACDVSMSDNQIKQQTADALLGSPYYSARAGVQTTAEFLSNAQWSIVTQSPTPRALADSEYDMAKYDVYARMNGRVFHVMFGKCEDMIVFGE